MRRQDDSAQNVISGEIRSIVQRQQPGADLDRPVTAEVTAASAERLGLAVGVRGGRVVQGDRDAARLALRAGGPGGLEGF